MVQAYHYVNATGTSTFDVTLGNVIRLGQIQSLTEYANLLETGQSSITLDDPNASLGHNSDAILGLQTFRMTESDETLGSRMVYTGTILDRIYSRGTSERPSLITTTARQITLNIADLNSIASDRIIYQGDGNRPKETPSARLTWLLASSYATLIHDNGYVDYPTTPVLDATDYRGQYPGDVLADIALACKFNVFIYWDETPGQAALWFQDSDTSTDYTSTLDLSGVLDDLDPTNPFAAVWGITDAVLNRSPDHTYAGVYYPYANGAFYNFRAATGDTYRWRDGVAPNANAKTLARAQNDVALLLTQSSTEEDRITASVELPSHLVNHIRAGMRIRFRAPWLPGYEDFVYCRILRRTAIQTVLDQLTYTLDLEMVPQDVAPPTPPVSCSTVVSAMLDWEDAEHHQVNSPTPVSFTPALSPSVPSIVIGHWAAVNNGEPIGGSPPAPVVSGFTTLGTNRDTWHGGFSTLQSVGYKAVASGSPGAMTTAWSGSTGSAARSWRAQAIAFATSATSPVQIASQVGSGSTATLPAAPTPGNLLILCKFGETVDFSPPNPPTGFTLVGNDLTFSDGIGTQHMEICYRCVVAGDPAVTYVGSSSKSHWAFLSEWALT